MVVRCQGLLPEAPEQLAEEEMFILRRIARWPTEDELDDDRILYWFSVPVNAIVFKSQIDDATMFRYAGHGRAARILSGFFDRPIGVEHPLIRTAPRRGRGIAFGIANIAPVWAERPSGVRVPFGWAYSADPGIKRWMDSAVPRRVGRRPVGATRVDWVGRNPLAC